jgi:hypothetical protein
MRCKTLAAIIVFLCGYELVGRSANLGIGASISPNARLEDVH